MIVPSIDIRNGSAVQLVGGKELKIDAGDPFPIAERFSVAGELAVIDLDAALGTGENSAIIRELVQRFDCRVGGGIRSVESAIDWLNAGASKVILGTAATPEVLSQLPPERTIAALDAVHGEVVTEGWTKQTGRTVLDRIEELREYVSGFLVTFVEREGRMTGLPDDEVVAIVDAAGLRCRVTVAGGVPGGLEGIDQIARADQLHADCQVGMALYTGELGLGEAVAAVFRSDREDGLIPTVVCDEQHVALGLVYSSRASIAHAVDERAGIYYSRARDELWRKGATSGHTQRLLRVDPDCDRDAARFIVQQRGGEAPGCGAFCHLETRSCFGAGAGVGELARTLARRLATAEEGSYTRRLAEDPELLRAKLHEEADELCDAGDAGHAAQETADLLYFALARAAAAGVSLADVERVLDVRARRVTRRSAVEANSTAPRGSAPAAADVVNDRAEGSA